jgi:hypothetical protein
LTYAGVQGLRTIVVLSDGRVQDGTGGAVFNQASDLQAIFHRSLLVGVSAVVVGALTLAGVRAAGALLLLGFTLFLGSQLYALVTLGVDPLLHGSLFYLVLSVVGFLSMINDDSLTWIRRG